LWFFTVVASVVVPISSQADADAAAVVGKVVFEQRCAACHMGGTGEAPTLQALEMMGQERILAALNTGVMKQMAAGLGSRDKTLLAEYLSPAASAQTATEVAVNYCAKPLKLDSAPLWNRWGNGRTNARFQPYNDSKISDHNVSSLKLKWAFGFPGATRARSQPAVTAEAIFTGSQDGTVYALDTQTGCVWWTFKAEAEVRSAISIDVDNAGKPQRLYFGDFKANVYSLNAQTGELLWKKKVDDHPVATITGSLTLHDGRLFVPVSSTEVVNAFDPAYGCCTFRGGIAALDGEKGEFLWRMYTVPEAVKQGKNSKGVQLWGPSGAPVWSSPTIDHKRGLLYVGTGENYSSPAGDKSDAIIAIDIDTGKVRWVNQTIQNDAWNGACITTKINCPIEDGPDFDFGAPPILVALKSGKDVILAGQKSGMVYAMDPDKNGQTIWQRRAGMGGFNGGIHWGMTTDAETLFVAIADTPGHLQTVGEARPGIHAFDVKSGAPLWSRFERPTCEGKNYQCYPALSAALTMTPGVVFAGGLNGVLHAYSTEAGTPLWEFETDRTFSTVNGVKAKGGSIDSDGAVIANKMLLINSGYDKFGEIPGNVLLVFEAD